MNWDINAPVTWGELYFVIICAALGYLVQWVIRRK